MKFQFDLLPGEYKSLPRDVLGIVLAVAAVIVCLAWTITLYLKNTKEHFNVQQQVAQAEAELGRINDEMGKLQPNMGLINTLKSSIQFINQNLDTPGSSWVDFLFALESSVPDRIYIRDLNPKDFAAQNTKFTLEGEAGTVYDVLDFVTRMQQSDAFQNVFLKQNSTQLVDSIPMTSFSLEFVYRGKGR
jgi:Tfp pilus assembly protein PilN